MGAEGTSGQEAPGRGAGWLHHYQYAPAGSMRLPGRAPSSRTGESLTNSRKPAGRPAATNLNPRQNDRLRAHMPLNAASLKTRLPKIMSTRSAESGF